MERFYDGDQEALFKAAHVINPYMVPKKEPKVKRDSLIIVRFVSRVPITFAHLDSITHFLTFFSPL
jgi:hypothetical protein